MARVLALLLVVGLLVAYAENADLLDPNYWRYLQWKIQAATDNTLGR